ncbi:MAG: type II toxin-antitoxin system PemK/MazF family toxin [Acidobacteriia bacterium]|nr:type II toxin-antitoxin system PemK/MazF family toxin [Terriglobia bacterium]
MPPTLRGEVYLANLEPVEGSEQGGTRPVVIVSRDAINKFSPVVVICPITDASNKKKVYPSHIKVAAGMGGLTMESIVLCEQVRAINKTRLRKQLGTFDRAIVTSIEAALKITLDLP